MAETVAGYAEVDGAAVAYQVLEGPGPTLVHVSGLLNHMEMMLGEPFIARHLERIATFSRLVIFDKRGSGQSDDLPEGATGTVDDHVADILAVIDALGVERVALLGTAVGAVDAIAFAADHPDRVEALAVYAASSAGHQSAWATDYRDVPTVEDMAGWGDPARPYGHDVLAPSRAEDPNWLSHLARIQRLAGSPGVAARLLHAARATDIGDRLSRVRCPTLVMHVAGDAFTHPRWAEPSPARFQMPGGVSYPVSTTSLTSRTRTAWRRSSNSSSPVAVRANGS